MSMAPNEVQAYVLTYLEATDCDILEKSPAHVTVKLSPEADKALTNRPYYWGFVERTGAPAETMSFTFVFDPEAYQRSLEAAEAASAASQAPNSPAAGGEAKESILGRYFGIAPALPQLGPGRILREDVVYGSRRLQQIFGAAREGGSYVNLFEQPAKRQLNASAPSLYEPWLGVCFKVEFACDLKREELHFLGISLRSGQIVERFGSKLNRRVLSPRLAENMHVQTAKMSLAAAGDALETHLTNQLMLLDYSWAEQAKQRLELELSVLDAYYEAVFNEEEGETTTSKRAEAKDASPDEDKVEQAALAREALKQQYETRRTEMIWQYEPKVKVTAISCGMFHLR
ncbi:YqhG family protein [Paenibacillus sp. JJ-223]|uniref:YqhG family protein n=1 Tax=Paenibacillus sp. JJ-223 TaxID=2905647 RepID=UPI001F26747A|nr:YqhG family protein [Paenibacillus sp. JJ-223]CAH1214966.1 hypothetical protein PAECIP111890_04171 [Paenibacillus sp. JJ-223]